MPDELIEKWRQDIVGEWRAELAGSDLLELKPLAGRYSLKFELRSDGTASYEFEVPELAEKLPKVDAAEAPIRTTWELSPDRVLSIWFPTIRGPDYSRKDWTREQACYDVLAVECQSLGLSQRRFDDGDIIIMRRQGAIEYMLRNALKAFKPEASPAESEELMARVQEMLRSRAIPGTEGT
jgi:hypothetical protein